MKTPSSGEPSPFSSSTHEPRIEKAASPASNLPASVQKIMAANARGENGGSLAVIASSYRPSGKVGPNAFSLMLVAALLGGLLSAVAYFYISPHFNFVLITQGYLGALVGAALWVGVKVGKVRSQRYSSCFAVLGTLVLFTTFHAATIWREREEALDFYAPSIAQSTKTSLSVARTRVAQQLTYARFAQLYWKDRYVNGVTLRGDSKSYGASNTETHLTGVAYIVFLLAEIGVTALAAAIVAAFPTMARFSESQERWYSKKRVFAVGAKEVWPVLQALDAEEWENARQIANQRKWKVADVGHVYISTVPGDSNGWVEMMVTQDKQQKLLFESEVELPALRALGAKI